MYRDDLVYIAGFVDGEGCILINKSKGQWSNQKKYRYSLRVTITQKHRDILDWINSVTHIDGYVFKHQKGKECYHLIYTDNKAYRFLELIYPFLRVKRLQAEIGMNFVNYKKATNTNYRLNRNLDEVVEQRDNYMKALSAAKWEIDFDPNDYGVLN